MKELLFFNHPKDQRCQLSDNYFIPLFKRSFLNQKAFVGLTSSINNLLLYFLVSFLTLFPSKSKAQCNIQDSLTLVEFYFAANGPNWTNNTNWLITPVDNWYGVVMGTPTSSAHRVVGVFLSNNNLSGTLTPLLFQLNELGVVNVSNNYLTGSLPSGIGNTKIGTLYLGNNNLTGPLPLSLGNSNSNELYILDISNNDFAGTFPDTIVSNPHLSYLYINGNDFSSIGHDHFLTVNLQSNNLTFKDLIYYKNISANNIVMPQDSLNESIDTTIAIGSTFVMDAWADTCSGNRYTWYKNGNWINWDSPSSNWTIYNAQVSNSGTYIGRVSNPSQCSNVYLYRKAIHLTVSPTANIETKPNTGNPCFIHYRQEDKILDISLHFDKGTYVEAFLYDECGRKVLCFFDGNTVQQDLHQYVGWMKKGIYVVIVTTRHEVFRNKIAIY